MHIIKKLMGVLFCMTIVNAYADTQTNNTTLVPTKDVMQNIDTVMTQVKDSSALPILFPKMIYVNTETKKLYASYSSDGTDPSSRFWQINADTTATCQGAHYCNLGSLMAQKNVEIEKYYGGMMPRSKREMKQVVTLANGEKGFITPAHAEADWHPTTLEWKSQDIVYTLTWRIKAGDEKQIITAMANSALQK